MEIKTLVTKLVSVLVDVPEEIRVEETETDSSIKIKIYSNPNDIGKIVGKKGRTIQSIRVYVNAVAVKQHNKKAIIDIDE